MPSEKTFGYVTGCHICGKFMVQAKSVSIRYFFLRCFWPMNPTFPAMWCATGKIAGGLRLGFGKPLCEGWGSVRLLEIQNHCESLG